MHDLPSPICPVGHAHVKLPAGALVHVAFALQPPLFVAHSFTSVHVTPVPV
jgi:hypothetical protein